ncbi:phosphotransferase [Mycoplasma marinum]|uniref:Aminoglycoside phosphotransferase domain-containing protein n=1 Tax=Mycoplasma marinum TaxID=1937190 RepID=A0A4R0XU20_9MOLU|nr:phosphotransferase [Mycoplasma marinum]TCG12028.1 hypothetical protein C4B24_00245 [Mycoplasma marinum]
MDSYKKIRIKGGFKNDTFKLIEGDKQIFVKVKKYDKFNHKLNYKIVTKFDFVPTLISENKEEIKWEFIETEKLELNDKNLRKMATILKQLHTSNIELPASNHKSRLQDCFNDLKFKKTKPKEIEDFYKIALDIVDEFDTNTPLHNDPWMNNFILSNKKIWLIDWEYASLGDKHFDLAFTIDGSYLDKNQEKVFLDAYGKYDKNKLFNAKILVNYLTLVWMHRFDELPFSDKAIIANLHKKR